MYNLAKLQLSFKHFSNKSLLQFEYRSPKSPSSSNDSPQLPVLVFLILSMASSIPVIEGDNLHVVSKTLFL